MPADVAPPRWSWGRGSACLVLLGLAVAFAFLPAVNHRFVYWDDDTNFMSNTHVRGFSAENLAWMWKASLLGVWQPLTWMITTAEHGLFGGEGLAGFSRGMHVTSLLLHALAAGLVFMVARRLLALARPRLAERSPGGLDLGALVAALLFAVHPLRVEEVAWASGQAYILALIPCLAAVWCYLRAVQTHRRRWHVAAATCLTLSLLCKAMAIPLVGVLLVLDFYPLRRWGGAAGWDRRRVYGLLLEKVPYAAVTLVVVVLTIWATWSTKSYRPEPISNKLLIASCGVMFYVAMTLVPYRLAPYYMKPSPFHVGDPWLVGAAVSLVLLTLGSVVWRRRWPMLSAAWWAYVLILLPVVGLIRHGGQMVADRYSYLSCIVWALLVGGVVWRAWASAGARSGQHAAWRRAVTLLLSGFVIVALTGMTRRYCAVWKDSVSVWSAMVQRNPRFHMGYYNLAKAHKRPGDALWKRAFRARKAGDRAEAEALFKRAAPYLRRAEEDYRRAIALYPTYPEANVDLGNMMKDGKAPGGAEEAVRHYQAALRGRPGFYMAHLNLGSLYLHRKQYDQAMKHLELAEAGARRSGDTKRLETTRRALTKVRRRARASLSMPPPPETTDADP